LRSPVFHFPLLMNWTTPTVQPRAHPRPITPKAADDFPLPWPVLTRTSESRGTVEPYQCSRAVRSGDMRFRQLGNSGLAVSVIGLGANNFGWRLDVDRSRPVIDAALEAGINFIDTSDSYDKGNSEQILGEVLKGRREEVVIATKFGSDMGGTNGPEWGARASRRYIVRAVEASLRRLQTDWIDLYQLHRPDGVTPFEETLEVLDELVRAGKIRYAGSSNLSAWQATECAWISKTRGLTRFVSAQNHYSLLERTPELDLVPACLAHDISLIPYFPLANGLLTGKWKRGGESPENSRLSGRNAPSDATFDVIEGLESVASSAGISLTELALAGLAAQPSVGSVIAGATSAEQARSNAAAGDLDLTADVLAAIDEVVPALR
jgi:aryl-alcohol dehydrogenase-like predicted oxidoreductase